MGGKRFSILGTLICALIFAGGLASAQTNADVMFTAKTHPVVKDWSAIDNYASNLTFSTSTSYSQAAAKICQTAKTEEEKARAIFAWIAHNIAYDVNLDGSFCYSADGVWKNRKGACQGYSLLYIELAKTVGLNCEYVNGNNKKNFYKYKNSLGSHGWVMVKLSSGKKMLLDPTWAAGNTDMVKKTFDFDYKDAWFDVDPYYMIMSHYPSNDSWQCLTPAVSKEKFDTLPRVEPDFGQCGIDGKELYDFYLTHNKAWAPDMMLAMHDVIKGGIKINKLPMAGTLKKNETYTFNLTIPSGQKMLIKVGGSWQNLTSNADFSAKPTSTDDLILGIGGAGGSIRYALVYSVADSPSLPWASDAARINSAILASSSSGSAGNSGNSGNSGSGSSGGSTSSGGTTTTPSTGPIVPSVTYGAAKYKGTDLNNIGVYTYPLRDGTTVNNQAVGKPKILIFYATYCQYCAKLTKDIAANSNLFSDVDVYMINSNNDSDQKITKYISDNNAQSMKFTVGTDRNGANSCAEYRKLPGAGTGIPFVLFIDCNNKIQYILNGCPSKDPAKSVRSIVDNYLIPKEGLPSVGTGTGTTTPTPTPSTPSTPSTGTAQKTDGLKIPNTINETFTLLDGSKVTSKANGKPKVLIFFQTICGRCMSTTRSIGPNYASFSDVDLYEIEINSAKKAAVQDFKNTYGSSAMKFAYDESYETCDVMWQYVKLIEGKAGSIGLPVIVYIDSNNVIQKYETAKSVTYSHIREIIDGYLKVKSSSSNDCEDGQCEVKPSTPAPSTPSTPSTGTATKTDGLKIQNSIDATFTLLDGSKVTSKANGKPKVLIFFQTICGRCMNTTKSIGPNYASFSDVDLYEIEINLKDKNTVQDFKTKYGSSAMKFAYDTTYNTNGVMWKYVRLCDPSNAGSIGLPVIVYIDSNNVIQKYETATSVTHGHIREIIDGYLKPKSSSSNDCEDGQCEIKPSEPQKPEVKPSTPTPEKKPEVKPETKPTPEKKPEVKPAPEPEKKPEVKPAPEPEKKPEVKPETKPAPAPVPEKKGPDMKNPVAETFKLVDGSSMSTTASGKPKILVFYSTSCGRTKNLLKNLNKNYAKFGDVDILFIETRKAKNSAVASFQKKFALSTMNFAYDSSNTAKKAMETYAKTYLPKVKTINTPLIVFIGSDNVIKDVVHGKALTASELRKAIDK